MAKEKKYRPHQLGQAAEEAACDFLKKEGLKLIVKNFNAPKIGEIDLIMQDKETIVFIEVRFRKNPDFGSDLESVTRHKQLKIIRTAKCYLQINQLWDKVPCRFDVIGAAWQNNRWHFEWIKSAFF